MGMDLYAMRWVDGNASISHMTLLLLDADMLTQGLSDLSLTSSDASDLCGPKPPCSRDSCRPRQTTPTCCKSCEWLHVAPGCPIYPGTCILQQIPRTLYQFI